MAKSSTTFQKGEKHPNWKGGRVRTYYKYWSLLLPDYFSSDDRGYVREHVYFYQEYHKCCLLPWTDIHHIIPVTRDYCNNMPWNLMAVMKSEHRRIHNKGNKYGLKNMDNRVCLLCGLTSKQNIKRKWHLYKQGHICRSCYKKLNRERETLNQKIRRKKQRELRSKSLRH